MTAQETRLSEQERYDADNRWRALSVCLVALFATLLDISVTNVALPSIGSSMHAGPSELQWVVSGYVLAFGLVPVIGGRLGDQLGRRTMFLVGVTGFVISSALVGFAPGTLVLIIGRFVQGLFGGLINPQVSGLIQQLFRGSERGRAFGTLGGVVGISTAVGPVLGGLLIGLGGEQYGWRLVFFINIPIGLTAVVLGRRWLPEPQREENAGSPSLLDLPGVALLGLTTICVLLPTVEYDSVRDLRIFWVAVPAVPLGLAFLRREWRLTRARSSPLIDLRLFRQPSYAVGVGLALLYFCGYSGLPLVLSLYYQLGRGFSALHSGLGVSAMAVGAAVGAPVAGRLVTRFGRPLLVIALLVFGAGAIAVALVVRSDPDDVALALVLPLLLIGLGSGAIITPNQTLALADVDHRMGSVAGGVLQTSQRLGSAIGQAVIGAVFFAGVAGLRGSAGGGSGVAHSQQYSDALSAAVVVTLLFVAASLLLGVVDMALSRRRGASITDAA